jgi:hypothetical protein
MAYPVAAPPYGGVVANPAYSGVFIPQIWSGKLIEKFYASTVLAAIANTDYEGEIKNFGDTVIIRTKPTISIAPYQIDMPLAPPQRPSSPTTQMTIDKGFYFNLIEDDVIAVQSDLNLLSMWSDDAAQQMKITIDTAVLATIDAGVDANNKGLAAGKISQSINLGATGTPVALTSANILNYIVDLGTVMGRWIIIPAWVAGLIKKSDLRNASISGDGTSLMRNGRIGGLDRFTLYSSNLLPVAAEGAVNATRIFAGHPHGLSFASQVSKMETLRSELAFGTLMRGLQVYGSKVLDGIALTELYAIRG